MSGTMAPPTIAMQITPVLELEDSLTAFVKRTLGLDTKGRNMSSTPGLHLTLDGWSGTMAHALRDSR
jgi:hypothetical protein